MFLRAEFSREVLWLKYTNALWPYD